MIALMMMAGAGTILFAEAATNETTLQGDALADVAQQTQYNLTLQIGANVEGIVVPMGGAIVCVWSVNVTQTGDNYTITLSKVATGTTDSNGNVTFGLEAGDYIITANYSGLQAFGQCTLDSDLSGSLLLHNWQCHPQRHMPDRGRIPSGNETSGY